MQLREFGPDDAELLVTATLGNLNWVEERFTIADVRERLEFRHYTELTPGRGDFRVRGRRGWESGRDQSVG